MSSLEERKKAANMGRKAALEWVVELFAEAYLCAAALDATGTAVALYVEERVKSRLADLKKGS